MHAFPRAPRTLFLAFLDKGGFGNRDFDPPGRSTIAQRFIAGEEGMEEGSPSRRDDRELTPSFDFDRPYGTWNTSYLVRLPSDESLGYCRMSLRDKDVGGNKGVALGERLGLRPAERPPFREKSRELKIGRRSVKMESPSLLRTYPSGGEVASRKGTVAFSLRREVGQSTRT
jgi:hypothetical protein